MFRIGYHNWFLVSLYCVVVGVFLYGLLRPRKKSEWASAGVAQAWVIALYAEMYGLPLTMYLLAGWLGRPELTQQHFLGHLWPVLLGWSPIWLIVFDVVGQLTILLGALLALAGWRQLHAARQSGQMATEGLYRHVRHPQYLGFFLFLLGSLINWPTIPTLLMLPLLIGVYFRLAGEEEQEALAEFGPAYRDYMARTGRFLPRLYKAQAKVNNPPRPGPPPTDPHT